MGTCALRPSAEYRAPNPCRGSSRHLLPDLPEFDLRHKDKLLNRAFLLFQTAIRRCETKHPLYTLQVFPQLADGDFQRLDALKVVHIVVVCLHRCTSPNRKKTNGSVVPGIILCARIFERKGDSWR